MSFCIMVDCDMKVKLILFIIYQRKCVRVLLLIFSYFIFKGYKVAVDRIGKEICKGFEKILG